MTKCSIFNKIRWVTKWTLRIVLFFHLINLGWFSSFVSLNLFKGRCTFSWSSISSSEEAYIKEVFVFKYLYPHSIELSGCHANFGSMSFALFDVSVFHYPLYFLYKMDYTDNVIFCLIYIKETNNNQTYVLMLINSVLFSYFTAFNSSECSSKEQIIDLFFRSNFW